MVKRHDQMALYAKAIDKPYLFQVIADIKTSPDISYISTNC
jgi:hypothetical protein